MSLLLELGDDRLILGHRISEWCGHGPMLEEDIALSNIALDLIGQASAFYTYLGRLEGKTEDDYAYRRGPSEFLNVQLVELPRGDFGETMARLFLWSSFDVLYLEKLTNHEDKEIAGLAAKSLKESKYHLKHSSLWVLRLGDGTKESHERIQRAFNFYWPYVDELFYLDREDLRERFLANVEAHLKEATLKLPTGEFSKSLGRRGQHTEHLNNLLSEMQFLPRTYPDAVW
jgi:ring-1,2-phenylacetyl-CoA epoxidase subunit PaaC